MTLLVTPSADLLPPWQAAFPILAGRVRAAQGHLGAFALSVEGLATASPSSRERLRFGPGRDGTLEADLVLDLTGGTPASPAPAQRAG